MPAGPRTRARQQVSKLTGGGGGGPAPAGNVEWGPNFGKVDDSTFVAVTAQSLDAVDFDGAFEALGAVAMTDVDFEGALGTAAQLDLFTIDPEGNLEAQGSISMDSVDLDGALEAFAGIDLWSVDPTGDHEALAGIDLDDVAFEGAFVTRDALGAHLIVTGLEPSDDAWIDQANPNTNHGSDTELECQVPVVNDARWALMQWDLSWTGDAFIEQIVVHYTARHSGPSGTNAGSEDWQISAAQIIDESTVTWNTYTRQVQGVEAPPERDGIPNSYASTFSELNHLVRDDMMDNDERWLLIQFNSFGGALNSPGLIKSKEHADTADRPTLDLVIALDDGPIDATGGDTVTVGTGQFDDGDTGRAFTTDGMLTVLSGSAVLDVAVVGGGGGGGRHSVNGGGGGGAGEVIVIRVVLGPGTYPVVVGTGGAGASAGVAAEEGGDSSFAGIVALGGGRGGGNSFAATGGGNGGGGAGQSGFTAGGVGRQNDGGDGVAGSAAGGGGGYGADGAAAVGTSGGDGGNGDHPIPDFYLDTNQPRQSGQFQYHTARMDYSGLTAAGGGGASSNALAHGDGGVDGGGNGASDGTDATGVGGGGGGGVNTGGDGADGAVYIRHRSHPTD